MKKYFSLLFVFLITMYIADARPEYSILMSYGAKCSSCHYNIQGGGVRNNFGWLARKDISIINPSSIGLKGLFDLMSNNYVANESITFGTDFRWQMAKWPPPIGRDFMVMQFSPYLVLQPFKWLGFEGFYNIAYDIASDKRFVGQNPYAASMYIKPADYLPSLRVGYFQPTVGIKYDDHTLLVRQVTGYSKTGARFSGAENIAKNLPTMPLIPDDYADLGAELDYEAVSWLSLSAGMFDTKNLEDLISISKTGQTIPVVDTGSVSSVFKAFVSPELIKGVNNYLCGTYLLNGDFYISSLSLGVGLPDKISFLAEYMRSEKKDSRLTLNFLAEVTYQLTDAILPYVRAERGVTKYKIENNPFFSNQFVFGAHFYPLPFIDLLPEYRIYNSEQVPGYSAEWTFQIHLFY
jgi:hypothetical protein